MDQGAAEFYGRAVEAYARDESLVGRRVPQEQHMEMLRQRLLEGLTLAEIGARHGLSGERIRQLLNFYFGLTGRRRDCLAEPFLVRGDKCDVEHTDVVIIRAERRARFRAPLRASAHAAGAIRPLG